MSSSNEMVQRVTDSLCVYLLLNKKYLSNRHKIYERKFDMSHIEGKISNQIRFVRY